MFVMPAFTAQSVKNDVLSGITVALALVPEAVAFAFVATVDPMVGLYAAFIMGLVTAIFGGRPGMISGATGATAVVMVSLVVEHGVQYLFAALVFTGIIQIAAGVFKLGKFIRMVPHPVMIGFVNGLAIVIFLAQLGQFQLPDTTGTMTWLQGSALYTMLGLVVLTMAIITLLPKLTTAVPASLVAIVAVTLLVHGMDLETRTVIDFVRSTSGNVNATLAGSLPAFALPDVPISLATLQIILPYSLILAAIGLIESLLTLTVIDEMTNTRGQGNRECIGQGMANLTCSSFGAMGGCAMIGQSMININSGGRGRLSGITAAMTLLIFILFAAAYIEMIPLAALVGVMFVVVIATFEWTTFKLARKVPLHDFGAILLVTAVTVAFDLAVAVLTGVIYSALVFAWQHAKQIEAKISIDPLHKTYRISGPIFFSSVANFLDLFDVEGDPDDVVVDFVNARVVDHSAIEAIENLADRYTRAGKALHLRHLSPECRRLLNNAGSLVEVNIFEDPTYRVVSDELG